MRWGRRMVGQVARLVCLGLCVCLGPAGVAAAIDEGPRATFELPASTQVETGRVTVRGSIEDADGVRGYRVYLNDRLVRSASAIERPMIPFSAELNVRQVGGNVVKIYAVNSRNDLVPCRGELRLDASRRPQKFWALVVGVGKYADSAVPGCDFCEDDAQSVATVIGEQLRAGGRYAGADIKITPLIGPQATRDAVQSALSEMVRQADWGDPAIFYFSGLATTTVEGPGLAGVRHALLLHDTKAERIRATGIATTELGKLLSQVSRQTIAVLDTSFTKREGRTFRAAQIVQPLSDSDRENLRVKLGANRWLEEVSSNGGVHVLGAARGIDDAEVVVAAKQGLFTSTLVDALSGGAGGLQAGVATLDERLTDEQVFGRLVERVRSASVGRQTPVRMWAGQRSPALPVARSVEVPVIEQPSASMSRPGVARVRATIRAQAGIREWRIEINGTVVRREVDDEGDRLLRAVKIDEVVLLEPFGNVLEIFVADARGVEKGAVVGRFEGPPSGGPGVSWSEVSAVAIPGDATRRKLKHDIQRLLSDADARSGGEGRTGDVPHEVFWAPVLEHLAALESESDPVKRQLLWGDIRNHVAPAQVSFQINGGRRPGWTEDVQLPLIVELEHAPGSAAATNSAATLQVVANGVVTERVEVAGKRIPVRAFLRDGRNRIGVQVRTPEGITRSDEFFVTRERLQETALLAVGVSNYKLVPPLAEPRNDAGALVAVLRKHTAILNDNLDLVQDPTRSEAVQALDKIAARQVERIVVYFSGYGLVADGEARLAMADYDPRRAGVGEVTLGEIIDIVERSPARPDLVLIVDAGFSGSVNDRGKSLIRRGGQSEAPDTGSPRGWIRQIEDRIGGSRSVALIIAGDGVVQGTTPGETDPDSRLSVFTRQLVAALRREFAAGGDERDGGGVERRSVGIAQVLGRVVTQVKDATQGRQNPRVWSELGRRFVLQSLPSEEFSRRAEQLLERGFLSRLVFDMERRDVVTARGMLEKALEADRETSGSDSGETANMLMMLGVAHWLQGSLETAGGLVRAAIAAAPLSWQRRQYEEILGYLELQTGRPKRAIDAFRAAAAPTDAAPGYGFEPEVGIVQALVSGGSFTEALRTVGIYEQNRKLREDAALSVSRGDVYLLIGDVTKARLAYEEATAKDRLGSAVERLGWLEVALGQFGESQQIVRSGSGVDDDGSLVDIDPFLVAAWQLTGLSVDNEVERMAVRYRRNPFTSAVLRFAIGQASERELFDAAQTFPFGRGAAAFYVALKEQKGGNRDATVKWLREVIDRGDPRYPERLAATTMLRRLGAFGAAQPR